MREREREESRWMFAHLNGLIMRKPLDGFSMEESGFPHIEFDKMPLKATERDVFEFFSQAGKFAQLEHAKAAQSLNGKLEIAGRTIKVSSVTDHVGVQDSGAKTADFDDDDGGGLG
ncbi:hypothetical protein Sango_0233200 [Sesamum angolense]|uniref:RRM domain-containing protein n=1 Tax=Sesamum angolense TaxID=2727404 RepID=A0AAE2C766_9LAMI|nr:hypothetical protein Sango_0233200 [Sesamum angolense]